jgi:hypothetical protein
MDDATRAYLKMLGNPYAKLSILDDEQPTNAVVATQASGAKRRSAKSDGNAVQASLFEMQNPYAKLSILSEEELALESADRQERPDLLWRTRTQVYQYVSEAFALPFVRTRPPELLKQFGVKVIRLSPRAQSALRCRIVAHLPNEHIVYNRLSPKELDRLFAKLLELADDAAVLDGEAD